MDFIDRKLPFCYTGTRKNADIGCGERRSRGPMGSSGGKDRTNYYIEEFAGILKRLLCGEKQSIGREKTEQKGDQSNG